MKKLRQGLFFNMKLRQKLLLGFLLCIIPLSLVGAFSGLQMRDFGRDMLHLLNSQNTFYHYQETVSETINLLGNAYGMEDAEQEIRALADALMEMADALREVFPSRATQDLWNSTSAFCGDGRIARLGSAAAYHEAATGLRRVLGLIRLQYGNVNLAMSEGIAEKQAAIDALTRRNTWRMIAVMVIVVVGCILLSVRWSKALVEPLDTLVSAAREVSWDRFDAVQLPNPAENDEIGYLMCAFSEMIERVRAQKALYDEKAQLEQQVAEEHIAVLNAQKLLKESELMILQSEINPHFLFNSMNLLRQMAYLEHAPTTGEIVEALSDMLRYSLSCMHRTATLADELENVRNYFYIQNKRFDDAIHFEIELAEERLLAMELPAMTLQPLVENAFKYCRLMPRQRCEIAVRAFGADGRLHLQVQDNGSGMSRERLAQVRETLEKGAPFEASSHIGLINVVSRLRIFFENDVGIDVESAPGEHTLIALDVPERAREAQACTAS